MDAGQSAHPLGSAREDNGYNKQNRRKHHAHRNGNVSQPVSQGSNGTDGNPGMQYPQADSDTHKGPSNHRIAQATIGHHVGNISSSSVTIADSPTSATTVPSISDQHASRRGDAAEQGGTNRDGDGST